MKKTKNYYIEDPQGNIKSKEFSDRRLKIYDKKPKLPIHSRTPPEMTKRNANLEKLEDAIYLHTEINGEQPYRIEYMKIFDEMRGHMEIDVDEYTAKLNTSRYKALNHCWDVLKWRPNIDGSKVHIN